MRKNKLFFIVPLILLNGNFCTAGLKKYNDPKKCERKFQKIMETKIKGEEQLECVFSSDETFQRGFGAIMACYDGKFDDLGWTKKECETFVIKSILKLRNDLGEFTNISYQELSEKQIPVTKKILDMKHYLNVFEDVKNDGTAMKSFAPIMEKANRIFEGHKIWINKNK